MSVTDLGRALVGSWVGTLEYRDYSESATSTKRVKLPTWLTVEAVGPDLRFRYIYDDGPSKIVTEVETTRIDPGAARYLILGDDGKAKVSYSLAGIDSLSEGRGTLTLSGSGIENGAPVQVRSTIQIGRNILTITRETASQNQPFTFRHSYTLVRPSAPGK